MLSLMGVGYLVSYLLGEEWYFLHHLAYIAIVSILGGIGVGIIVLRRRSRQSQLLGRWMLAIVLHASFARISRLARLTSPIF